MTGRRSGWWSDAIAWLAVALVAGTLAPLSARPAAAAAAVPTITTVASTTSAVGLAPTAVDSFLYVGHDAAGSLYGVAGTINGAMRFAPGGTLAAAPLPAGYAASLIFDQTKATIAPDGTMYINKTTSIERVNPDGTATVVVGTGVFGFSGDGGPAASAQIAANSIAFGPDGTMVLFEATRIRRATIGGNIATIAGTGTAGNTGDGGPAVSAQISPWTRGVVDGQNRPVFVNSNCIFLSCRGTSIRRIELDGTITTRTTAPGNDGIVQVAAAADGTVYFTTTVERLVPPINFSTQVAGGVIERLAVGGTVTTVAGLGPDTATAPAGDGGPATAAAGTWYGIDVLPDGTVVTVEPELAGWAVRAFTVGGIIQRVAGLGPVATASTPSLPLAVAGDSVLVGTPGLVARPGSGVTLVYPPEAGARLSLARTPAGAVELYDVLGTGPGLTKTRSVVSPAGTVASGPSDLLPVVASYRPDGTLVYGDGLAAATDCRIWERPPGGSPRVLAGAETCPAAPAVVPVRNGALAASPDGAVYNTDGYRVLRIAADGTVTVAAGKPVGACAGQNTGDGGPALDACFSFVNDVAVDGGGNVFVSTPSSVRRLDKATGAITRVVGAAGSAGVVNAGDGGPATDAELANAYGIAFDRAGNLYVSTVSAVRKVTGLGVPFAPTLVPVVPERVLETRTDGQAGYSGGKPGPGAVIELQITGVGRTDVPDDAVAVVLNITATEATADGFVTVWPCGEERPTASNLNLVKGGTAPNLVITKIGAGGKVCLYTQSGAHLLADVSGYYPPGAIVPVSPERLLETRPDGQNGYSGAKPAPGAVVELQVTGAGRTDVPDDAKAVVLNVTGVDATADGFVTVWPCGEDRPTASNLNLRAGSVVPNLVIAKIGAGGKVCLFSQNGTHLLADVAGYFPASAPLVPVSPERLLETRRDGQTGYSGDKPAAGRTIELQVTGAGRTDVPADAAAAVLNVTGVDATADGFVTVWPCGQERPTASNLNLTAGAIRPNLVITKIGAGGKVCLYTQSGTHLVADINGYVPAG